MQIEKPKMEEWQKSLNLLREMKEKFLDVSNDEIIEMKIQIED